MGLMAGVAKRAAGMFGGVHLRKIFGLGGVLLMAAAAENRDIGKLGYVRLRVIGMLCQGTVASLAGDVGVFAGGPGFGLVVMAQDAGILPGKRDGMAADEIEGARTVVAVLPEGLGNHGAPHDQKNRQSG